MIIHEIYRGMNCNLGNAKYLVESITFLMFESQTCIKQVFSISDKLRPACGHGDIGTGPHQVLAATLTLFTPGGTDYAHHIPMSPPSFGTHRRAGVCNVCIKEVLLNALHQSFCNWIY